MLAYFPVFRFSGTENYCRKIAIFQKRTLHYTIKQRANVVDKSGCKVLKRRRKTRYGWGW